MTKTTMLMILLAWRAFPVRATAGGLRQRYLDENITLTGDEDDVNATTIIVEGEHEITAEELVPEDPPEIDSPPPPPVPPNDLCSSAQSLPLSVRGFNGMPESILQGTTVGATKQDVDACRGGRYSSPMVWYTAVGTGSELTVSTCYEGTDLDTRISVFTGTCNGELTCVAYNDDALNPSCEASSLASRASWQSEWGVTYYILVHGFHTREGDFEISLEARNDWCTLAQGMTVGDVASGDTSASQFNLRDVLANCGYTEKDYHGEWHRGPWDHQPRGRWYKVVGTGNPFIATTCKSNGDQTAFFAHRLHVFTGDCNQCLGGEESPRQCVTYEWDTIPGQIYNVVIHRAFPGYDTTVESQIPAQFATPPQMASPTTFDLSVEEVGAGSTIISRTHYRNWYN